VALNVEDAEFGDDGLRVTIRRSKTDQEGAGVIIAVVRGGPCCPSKALREWLDVVRSQRGRFSDASTRAAGSVHPGSPVSQLT